MRNMQTKNPPLPKQGRGFKIVAKPGVGLVRTRVVRHRLVAGNRARRT